MTVAYGGHVANRGDHDPPGAIMILTDIIVVACDCGNVPLDKATHRTATDAWNFAAAHVALTGKCTPVMFRDTVPAALVPKAA